MTPNTDPQGVEGLIDYAAPPWSDNGIGKALDSAAEALLNDYAFGSDEGADHEPSEFERAMLHDAYAHVMGDETFFGPIRKLLASHESLRAELERVREALNDLQDVFARDGECSMERFERLAEMFRRDTGFMAPGKDPGMCGPQQPEGAELREIYDAWFAAKVTRARTALNREG